MQTLVLIWSRKLSTIRPRLYLDGSRLSLDSFQCLCSFLFVPSTSTLCVPNGTHQFFWNMVIMLPLWGTKFKGHYSNYFFSPMPNTSRSYLAKNVLAMRPMPVNYLIRRRSVDNIKPSQWRQQHFAERWNRGTAALKYVIENRHRSDAHQRTVRSCCPGRDAVL